jgi:hypothetical protein
MRRNPLRTRTQGDGLEEFTAIGNWYNQNGASGTFTITTQSWHYFSTFVDEGGPIRRTSLKNSVKLKAPKSCFREQYWLRDCPYRNFRDWNRVDMFGGKMPVDKDAVRALFPPVPLHVAQAVGREAWTSMSTQLDVQSSLANFMIELRDVRSLVEHVPNLFKGFVSVAKKGGFVGNPVDAVHWLRKETSNAHLQWEFGIKPMLSDIKKLANVTQALLDRISWLEKTRKKPTTIHHTSKVAWSPDLGSHYIGSADLGTASSYKIEVNSFSSMFHAQAVLYHELDLSAGALTLKNYLKVLGFDNPAKVAWNALPFSFVVDWFLNTSEILKELDSVKSFEGIWVLTDPISSFKEEGTFNVYHTGRPGYGNPWVYTGYGEMRKFRRIIGIPFAPVQAELSGLTPGQQLLGLSLLNALAK